MALVDENGVPKTRPVPQAHHVDHFQKEADRKRAIEVTMIKDSLTWPEAEAKVDATGHEEILKTHHGVPPEQTEAKGKKFSFEPGYSEPSAEDLDAVASEEKIKEATGGPLPPVAVKPKVTATVV